MDAQGDEPLLRAVVQVAPDALALGALGFADAGLRRAQLARERAVLDRQQRRRRRRPHQLGILGQRLVDHHRRDGLPVVLDRHPHAARRPRGVRISSPPPASRNSPDAGSW